MPFKAVTVIMGDTATSVNQGGASGSTGIQFGGKQMRMAAAEARRVLLDMAAAEARHAGRSADRGRRPGQRRLQPRQEDVLRRADRRQVLQCPARVEQADRQPALCPRQGAAEEAHRVQDRRQVDPARRHRADGVRHGGLRHRRQGAGHGARPHDPPAGRGRDAGQGRRRLDQGHPGRQGGLGERLPRRRRRQGMGRDQGGREAQGRVVGRQRRRSRTRPRSTTTSARRRCATRKVEKQNGNVDEAFRNAARVVEAEYEWPFQSHACMGPALRRGRCQGRQGRLLDRLAEVAFLPRRRRRHLGVPVAKVEGIWMQVPAAYGRNDAGDACMDCRGAGQGGRQAGARCNTCATKAPAGTRRARPRSTAPAPRSMPAATSWATSSSPRASRAGTCRPTKPAARHARRPLPRRAAEVRGHVRRAGGVL